MSGGGDRPVRQPGVGRPEVLAWWETWLPPVVETRQFHPGKISSSGV